MWAYYQALNLNGGAGLLQEVHNAGDGQRRASDATPHVDECCALDGVAELFDRRALNLQF